MVRPPFPRLLLSLSLALNCILLAAACGKKYPMPRWDGEFWKADHTRQAVVIETPGQPPRGFLTSDPFFSEGYWVHEHALSCLYQQVVMNCASWKEKQPKCKYVEPEAMQLFVEEANRRGVNFLKKTPEGQEYLERVR